MPDLTRPAYVFAYGSLVADAMTGAFPATLAGHRRDWGVAMDNRVDVPGYKRYRDPVTGRAPEVFVAFLDVVPAATAVNGVCVPATDAQLYALDRRERNYDRVDVSALISPPVAGCVWTYRGNASGRSRAREGHASGTLVVARDYADQVLAAFAALGDEALQAFWASTDGASGPIVDLVRENVAP